MIANFHKMVSDHRRSAINWVYGYQNCVWYQMSQMLVSNMQGTWPEAVQVYTVWPLINSPVGTYCKSPHCCILRLSVQLPAPILATANWLLFIWRVFHLEAMRYSSVLKSVGIMSRGIGQKLFSYHWLNGNYRWRTVYREKPLSHSCSSIKHGMVIAKHTAKGCTA